MLYKPKYKEYGTIGIIVKETGHDYDFIATIENDTDKTLNIYIDDLEGWYSNSLVVEPHNWAGLLADDEGYGLLESIKAGDFKAVLEDFERR